MTTDQNHDVLVITTMEHNPKTNRKELIVSHGVDMVTGRDVVLPCDHPETLGAVLDKETGEWMLRAPDSSSVKPRAIAIPAAAPAPTPPVQADAPKRRFFRR